MPRSTRCLLVALMLALGLAASGCDIRELRVELAGFDAAQIDGLWIWRLSEVTSQYERDGRIRFERSGPLVDPYYEANPELEEVIVPVQVDLDGSEFIHPPASVLRDPVDPDLVTLRLHYLLSASGLYKATAYNAAGESALSAETATL